MKKLFVIGTEIYLNNIKVNIEELEKNMDYAIYYFGSIDLSKEYSEMILREINCLLFINIEKVKCKSGVWSLGDYSISVFKTGKKTQWHISVGTATDKIETQITYLSPWQGEWKFIIIKNWIEKFYLFIILGCIMIFILKTKQYFILYQNKIDILN